MGGSKPKKPKPAPIPVSTREDPSKQEARKGSSRRSLGAQFLSSRKRTKSSSGGFGGTKATLG